MFSPVIYNSLGELSDSLNYIYEFQCLSYTVLYNTMTLILKDLNHFCKIFFIRPYFFAGQ